jgi:hypothetical protein
LGKEKQCWVDQKLLRSNKSWEMIIGNNSKHGCMHAPSCRYQPLQELYVSLHTALRASCQSSIQAFNYNWSMRNSLRWYYLITPPEILKYLFTLIHMSISCSKSEIWSVVGIVVHKDDGRGTTMKMNDSVEWSSDVVVLWLKRRQNRIVVEWWREWSRLIWPFNSSGGWQSDCPGRVAGGGVTDSMLRFQLKIWGDRTKQC